jgi:hypothetical protein
MGDDICCWRYGRLVVGNEMVMTLWVILSLATIGGPQAGFSVFDSEEACQNALPAQDEKVQITGRLWVCAPIALHTDKAPGR